MTRWIPLRNLEGDNPSLEPIYDFADRRPAVPVVVGDPLAETMQRGHAIVSPEGPHDLLHRLAVKPGGRQG